MSKTAVIVVMLVAALLLGAWLFLGGTGPNKPPTPSTLAGFDSNSITEINVAWPSSDAVTLRRQEPDVQSIGCEWALEWKTGSTLHQWPAEPARVRGALRLIGELGSTPPSDGGASLTEPTTVRLISSKQQITLRLGGTSLGGRSPVEVTTAGSKPDRLLASDSLRKIFDRVGIMSWRTARVFPRTGWNCSRASILSGTASTIALQRIRNSWSITQPIASRCQPESIAAMTKVLADLSILRFVDDADMSDPAFGFAKPAGSLNFETDIRAPSGTSLDKPGRVFVEHLLVGGPADVSRSTVFVKLEANASVGSPHWGPVVAVVDRESLEQVSGDPFFYVTKSTLPFPSADIQSVRVTLADAAESRFDRTLEGFKRLIDSKASGNLTPKETAGIAALLSLLCEKTASTLMGTLPGSSQALAEVEVTTPDGAFAVTLSSVPFDGIPKVLVTIGAVTREYKAEGVGPIIDWLMSPKP